MTLAAAVAVLATLGYGGRGMGRDDTAPPTPTPQTASVTRMDLIDQVRLSGKIGYGSGEEFVGKLPGTLTKIAGVGTVLRRGDVAYRVDEQPVIVLIGELPAYRALTLDVEGPDVEQFEENLRALGYRGFTVDESFGKSTAQAVKQWQRDLGLTETGSVELGRIAYVADPVRIAELKQRVGETATPGTAVFTVTGTTRTVTMELDTKASAVAKVNTKVQVRAEDGKPTGGVMTAVKTVQDTTGQPKTAVTVTVSDQSALGKGDTVEVVVVRAEKKDVLTVPVVALLAVGDGYGVELFGEGGRQVVPVTVGMFAQGRAEVSSPELAEGMIVGVASS
ncbi:peptidoglycan-binding protein [Micromonospora sp. NPDC050417]|uniref:peptidoglycan-binding protein n=1 Tax=Micromonospora sp. NPDC050417 TaxID=3364280 RepID=UPI00378EE713